MSEANAAYVEESVNVRRLYVGGLHHDTKNKDLKSFYQQFGNVSEAFIVKTVSKKNQLPYGFVTFQKAFSVDKAQANRPHVIFGRPVESKRAVPKDMPSKFWHNKSVKKLFVGRLNMTHDEKSLKEYFSKFGNVMNVEIYKKEHNYKYLQHAFVEFDDYDPVDKITLTGPHYIKNYPVEVEKQRPIKVRAVNGITDKKNNEPQTSQNGTTKTSAQVYNNGIVAYPQMIPQLNIGPSYPYNPQMENTEPRQVLPYPYSCYFMGYDPNNSYVFTDINGCQYNPISVQNQYEFNAGDQNAFNTTG